MTDSGSPALSATNSFTVTVREVNVAPTLPVIPNQTVSVLTLMTVTNTATNANIHSTITGYTLVNPPTGASISPSGVITWTPSQPLVPGTDTITTVVTNNNPYDLVNPRLTATNSFQVTVTGVNGVPAIETIVFDRGNLVLTWTAVSGKKYRLQFNNAPGTSQWTDLPPDVLASGPTVTVTNAIGNASQRFYRVLLVQ